MAQAPNTARAWLYNWGRVGEQYFRVISSTILILNVNSFHRKVFIISSRSPFGRPRTTGDSAEKEIGRKFLRFLQMEAIAVRWLTK
jgi:hypothetical protein